MNLMYSVITTKTFHVMCIFFTFLCVAQGNMIGMWLFVLAQLLIVYLVVKHPPKEENTNAS